MASNLNKSDKAFLNKELISQFPQETINVKRDLHMKLMDLMALVPKLEIKKKGLHKFVQLAKDFPNAFLLQVPHPQDYMLWHIFINK